MASRLHLFQATGIELEYMIVDRRTLAVRPIADEVLKAVAGEYAMSVERGPLAWSNELALHVIELKTNGPAASLPGLAADFQAGVRDLNGLLAPHGACLLPTGMHPWMDPHAELRLWPHEDDAIYNTFHRIFDCRGHGWANLQSMHLNLPFANDEEFGRLHAAVRLVLPLLPALAASSPVMDGRVTGVLDNRLAVYRHNARRVPSVSGAVIPEPVYTQAAYEQEVLQRIYVDLAPHDPEGIIRHEWVNARGAIARFDRHAIEIRVLDTQECPAADLALGAAIVGVVRALAEGRLAPPECQRDWPVAALTPLLWETVAHGSAARVTDEAYLALFGWHDGPCTARALWTHLLNTTQDANSPDPAWAEPLDVLRSEGTLAERIVAALAGDASHAALERVYRHLAACLAEGRVFRPGEVPTA